ncbi:hypothetical protein E8E12_003575 [Didymella heteroderae]|uniref:BTB domain-containing protein n=1 Tax=Didymella heteroderae TaxID=1769908 RepID=A0A9P4WH50_9PLEO|nr:hypothetical protein E8E12_003575 [Didymella heteroderae]
MKPEWTELREQPDIIDLPDDSVQTVSDYIRWLYSDILPIKLYNAGKEPREKAAKDAEKVFVLLAEAYVFGEKIVDTKYKNVVIRTVLAAIESSGWFLGLSSVHIIYNGTPSTSPLRRLVADTVACHSYDDSEVENGWMDDFDGYPREALLDAMKATVKARLRPEHDMQSCIDSYLEKEQEEREQRGRTTT